jgi:hypothetical protein
MPRFRHSAMSLIASSSLRALKVNWNFWRLPSLLVSDGIYQTLFFSRRSSTHYSSITKMTTISHQTSRGRSSSRYISSDHDDYYGPHPTKSAQMIAVVARSQSRSRSVDRFRSRSRSIDRAVVTKKSRSTGRVSSLAGDALTVL